MPKTVYCTFDDSDIADIAMGSLRRSGLSINTIDNVGDIEHPAPHSEPDFMTQMSRVPAVDGNVLLPGLTQSLLPGIPPMAFDWGEEGAGEPVPGGHPATFKITCGEKDCQEVVAKLINFGAHRVRYY